MIIGKFKGKSKNMIGHLDWSRFYMEKWLTSLPRYRKGQKMACPVKRAWNVSARSTIIEFSPVCFHLAENVGGMRKVAKSRSFWNEKIGNMYNERGNRKGTTSPDTTLLRAFTLTETLLRKYMLVCPVLSYVSKLLCKLPGLRFQDDPWISSRSSLSITVNE